MTSFCEGTARGRGGWVVVALAVAWAQGACTPAPTEDPAIFARPLNGSIVTQAMTIQDVLAKQLEFDRALLTQLKAGGDNASVVHKVEHHFLATQRDPLVSLSEYARGLGFEPSEIAQHEHGGSKYWVVDLVSQIRLDDGRISRYFALMSEAPPD